MVRYIVKITPIAERQLEKIRLSGNIQLMKRIKAILLQLEEHPTRGIGKPERLKYDLEGLWSRRIDQKIE